MLAANYNITLNRAANHSLLIVIQDANKTTLKLTKAQVGVIFIQVNFSTV